MRSSESNEAGGDASGTRVIWSYLPQNLLSEVQDFAEFKLVERDEQKTLSGSVVSKAQFLFVEEHRALLKQLCDELEYIEEDWQ